MYGKRIFFIISLFREYHPLGVFLLAVDNERVNVHSCAELCAVDYQAVVTGGYIVALQLLALHVEDADVCRARLPS